MLVTRADSFALAYRIAALVTSALFLSLQHSLAVWASFAMPAL